MYSRKIDAPSSSHYCRGKSMSTTYFECMFVALNIHAPRVRHIVTCGLPGFTILFRIIS